MTKTNETLAGFGWSHELERAARAAGADDLTPVRVIAVHRDALEVAGPTFAGRIPAPKGVEDEVDRPTAGDWLLLKPDTHGLAGILPRKSLFKRRAAGVDVRMQLIAANVDTALIVTSANVDFNAARLERYLALTLEAQVTPIVMITKADLCPDISPYLEAARGLMPGLLVESVDAREAPLTDLLGPWLAPGQTLVVLGSSGVGKSTIVNNLMSADIQQTQGVREDDVKGRHTTTGRSLHRLRTGAWLMDTPGMRELQITDVADGINAVFSDVATMMANCKFSDCTHANEPGCAIRTALADGTLQPDRLLRFQKLQREERHNTEALHLAHARNKAFGKKAKANFKAKLKRTRDW